MIEQHVLYPAILVVTVIAGASLLTFMHIILFVARDAVSLYLVLE